MRIFLGHSSKNKTVKRFVYTSEVQSSQAVALCSLPDGSDFFFFISSTYNAEHPLTSGA